MTHAIKEPNAPATYKQTRALFFLTKQDWRDKGLTRQEASDLIDKYQNEKQSKGDEHAELFARAWQAGVDAANACTPVPMTVVQHANPLDDDSPIVKSYGPIADGVCGFAWVSVPGNTGFGRWLKKEGKGRKGYPSGIQVWIGAYGQSYERKIAHARAMAAVLRGAGIEQAYGTGRLD